MFVSFLGNLTHFLQSLVILYINSKQYLLILMPIKKGFNVIYNKLSYNLNLRYFLVLILIEIAHATSLVDGRIWWIIFNCLQYLIISFI
jgi:hypothetical protein